LLPINWRPAALSNTFFELQPLTSLISLRKKALTLVWIYGSSAFTLL